MIVVKIQSISSRKRTAFPFSAATRRLNPIHQVLKTREVYLIWVME